MNKPKLRFKDFSGEWKQRKLGELAEVRTGKAFSSADFNDNGEYLVITNKNIQDEANGIVSVGDRIDIDDEVILDNYLLSGDNILVTMDGVNIGKTGKYSNEKAVLAQRVGRLNSEQHEFIYQITSSNNFVSEMNKLSVGNAIKHISLKQISDYSFSAPISEEEQGKIGAFFSNFDQKIKLQKEKIDLLKEQKKGYMQKIYSQELRFKAENGKEYSKWNIVKLHSLVEQVKGNSLKNVEKIELPVLTISAKSGFVNQQDRFSEVIAGNSLSKYTELEINDLSYNKGNSKTAKYGCVFVQSKHQKALVPNVYKSFRAKENVNPFYLQYLFATKLLDRQLKGIISSTARMDGLLNVSDEDFYNLDIPCPSFNEQNKIVNFLSTLDRKIEIEEKKMKSLQDQKQAFMQQMFI